MHIEHNSRLKWVLLTFLLICNSSFAEKTTKPDRFLLARMPIQFEPNNGQAEPSVRFLAHATNVALLMRPNEFELRAGGLNSQPGTLMVRFVNANRNVDPVGSDRQPGESNYLLGQDPSQWHTHIPNFSRVTYPHLYPGIDAVFYGTGQRLEHDFIVSPGADYRAIRMRLAGAKGLSLQADGRLRVGLEHGELFFEKPQAYQIAAGRKQAVTGAFTVLGSDEVAFRVGNYDHSKPLVIDPVLTYSTFFADFSIAVSAVGTDAAGNTYITGETNWSSFPITPGSFQQTCKSCPNGNDVFVIKLTPDGSALGYSTFLGGTNGDQSSGISVDSAGHAIVVGTTGSTDFPLKNPISHGYEGNGTAFGFVTSLSADGAALNYSSIMGGGAQPGQSSGTGITVLAVDTSGNAYVSGITDSPVFPVTPGALNQGTPAYPEWIVFVSKFAPAGTLAYSSLLGDVSPQNGGGGPIGVTGIAFDQQGSAYITGTGGTLWPTTPGAYQTQIPGASPYAAPFVTKLAADASSLQYSTFLGGDGTASGIAVNGNEEAIVAGFNVTSTFPTTSNAYKPTIPPGQCCPAYLSRFSADGSQLLYSTFFYGDLSFPPTAWTAIFGVALDDAGNIWLGGNTSDVQLPLQQPIQSVVGSTWFSGNLGFISEFDPSGTTLKFSTYFGGLGGGVWPTGLAFDGQGKVHIAGTANYRLYTSPGVYLESVTPNPDFAYGFALTIDPTVAAPAMCVAYPANQGLFFGDVPVHTVGTLTLQIKNCGTLPLSMSSFEMSSSFYAVPSDQNGCLQQVAVNATCTLTATFAPTVIDAVYPAVLTISANTSMPMLMPVSGTGIASIGLSASGSGSANVTAGETAHYTISIGGEGIVGTAAITCTGAPLHAVCSVPATVPVSDTTPSSFSVTVSTTASSRAGLDSPKSFGHWLWAVALVGALILPVRRRRDWNGLRRAGAIAAVAGLALLLSCGGGSGSPGTVGTPPGTYTLTITAKVGATSQSLPLTLVVK